MEMTVTMTTLTDNNDMVQGVCLIFKGNTYAYCPHCGKSSERDGPPIGSTKVVCYSCENNFYIVELGSLDDQHRDKRFDTCRTKECGLCRACLRRRSNTKSLYNTDQNIYDPEARYNFYGKCLCGCNESTRSKFKQGHDARLKGWLLRAEKGETMSGVLAFAAAVAREDPERACVAKFTAEDIIRLARD